MIAEKIKNLEHLLETELEKAAEDFKLEQLRLLELSYTTSQIGESAADVADFDDSFKAGAEWCARFINTQRKALCQS